MGTITKTTATARTSAAGVRDLSAETAFLTRALKAPTLRESVARLAERARAESWTHEEFLWQREVSARESHGGEGRIRAARFPARKSSEEFDFDHARGLKRDTIGHLGTLDFVAGKENVVFLGPPRDREDPSRDRAGDPHLSGRAPGPVRHRRALAHHDGTLQAELVRLGRYPLLVVDEVGYIPFEPEAANLFFQLVSSRYERASLIVTSNKVFGRWGEVFGDDVVDARDDRPAGPPRRSHRPQGRQLPTQRPRPGPRPRSHHHRGLKIKPLFCLAIRSINGRPAVLTGDAAGVSLS
jgi:DNA replication protein DnaC